MSWMQDHDRVDKLIAWLKPKDTKVEQITHPLVGKKVNPTVRAYRLTPVNLEQTVQLLFWVRNNSIYLEITCEGTEVHKQQWPWSLRTMAYGFITGYITALNTTQR